MFRKSIPVAAVLMAACVAYGQQPKAEVEKQTYVGVSVKPADKVLQAQLKLPDGVGLVVVFVDAKGPAGEGLKAGDVLQKLDDQLLVNQGQFLTLVRMHKPGEQIKLTAIRQATPVEVAVTLGGRDKPAETAWAPADDPLVPVPDFNLPGVRMQPLPVAPNAFAGGNGNHVSLAFNDGVYGARVESDPEGHLMMTVKDKGGAVVAEGPVDTEAQWDGFPDDVKQHLRVMHTMIQHHRREPAAGEPPRAGAPVTPGAGVRVEPVPSPGR